MATWKVRATLKGHTAGVAAVAFTPDGKTLASGSWDDTVKLWDVEQGKERATLKGHTNYVRGVAISGDGQTLASGSLDGTVKLWDVATGKERLTLQENLTFTAMELGTGGWQKRNGKQAQPIQSVALTEDGRRVAAGRDDGTVSLWEVSGGR